MTVPGSLADRLRRMKDSGHAPRQGMEAPRQGMGGTDAKDTVSSSACGTSLPPGWERCGEWVWRREVRSPLLLGRHLSNPVLNPVPLPVEALRFLDVETTGLSTGAGSVAFLVGIGHAVSDEFVTTQFFLSDFPGEAELLDAVEPSLPSDAWVVSYNGKAFDSHVLRSRAAMNGRSIRLGRQIDLLFPVRWLYRSLLESCTLATVEREILHIERSEDVPSHMVPELYFEYLRDADPQRLRPVFAHHLRDVETLQVLLAHLDGVLRDPFRETLDRLGAGRRLLEVGDPNGEALLNAELSSGSLAAGITLGTHYRRRGELASAQAVWERLYNEHGSITAAVELAKHHEHRTRNLRAAERLVVWAIDAIRPSRAHGTTIDELRYRLKRIRRKLAKREGQGSAG